ncbi:hypothetical protein BN159_0572 [Streptomyces davaonensis JCM 4913]|uniref:Uncharacterized protein n=1 Tax=Streptomyces davaonensis (strain DSM 101723 / JCM 4913 / KCC S-0913 / 768) TaxID=1214101 RepID=K4QSN3_STRDJ|nr:hypothetical protein [Streptomyces davaonensis]CCK24951.1 hypothetical protein BN159_0572 [Streptomyces davaonensis JCM 4913]
MGLVRLGPRSRGWAVGGIIGLAMLYVIGVFAFGGAGWVIAPFDGSEDERETTVEPAEFSRTTYEEFADLCEAVRNAEGTIEALREERESASTVRATQIDQSITALKATRIESVNDYNSKAAREEPAPFRDQDLPYRLDATAKHTTCAH